MSREQRLGHLAMLLFSALVAGSFSLGSRIANDVPPDALTAFRFWIAAGLVGGVGLALGQMRGPVFAAPWRFVVLGTLFGSYFVLMFEGLKTAAPVSTSAVFTLTPVMAAGFGWLLLRQRLTGRMAVALGFGAVGALWVIFRADLAALMRFEIGRGELIYFGGCAAHALYTPLAQKLSRGEGPFRLAFATLVVGAVVLTLWSWGDIRGTDWAGLGGFVWGTILYVTVMATAVTFVLLQVAIARLPAAKIMAYTYLTPTWVIGWELALGGVPPPMLVLAGLGLTLLALWLLLRDDAVPVAA